MSAIKYGRFKELCQERGLKATSQRFIILNTLISKASHPTADQLFDDVTAKLPSVSRDTVYRTLNIFAASGLVKRLMMPGGATHFDGDIEKHHHFLCESCGKILDFLWPEFESLGWPTALEGMEAARLSASVLITGQCRHCKSQ